MLWRTLLAATFVACGAPDPQIRAVASAEYLPPGVRWAHRFGEHVRPRGFAWSSAPAERQPTLYVLTSDAYHGGAVARLDPATGVPVGPAWEWSDTAAVAVDVEDEQLWFGAGALLHEVGATDGRPINTSDLGDGVQIAAIEVGYGQTAFIADGRAATIRVVQEGTATPLVQGEILRGARSLLIDGGKLLVGTDAGVVSVDLRTKEQRSLAATEEKVTGLVLDHLGYYVVSLAGGQILRVTPEGLVTPLELPMPARGPLAFDPHTRTLIAVGKSRHIAYGFDYLAVIHEDADAWAARDARPMRPFEENGYELTGAEYWTYRGESEPDYPDDVLWGFYPETGVVFEGAASPATPPPSAVACAEVSYFALRAFLRSDPPELREAVGLGKSNRFYLWVNDYSEAANPFPQPLRPARLWYWQRNPAVVGRIPGFWKWETTLTQTGKCQVPTAPHEGLTTQLAD